MRNASPRLLAQLRAHPRTLNTTTCTAGSTLDFESLEHQLQHPKVMMVDFAKTEGPATLLLCLRALEDFRAKVRPLGRLLDAWARHPRPLTPLSRPPWPWGFIACGDAVALPHGFSHEQHSRLPAVWDASDGDEFVSLAEANNAAAACPLPSVDKHFLRAFSYSCRGNLGPLSATLGGWAAQEVIKGLSGKFTPTQQWVSSHESPVKPYSSSAPAAASPLTPLPHCAAGSCLGNARSCSWTVWSWCPA